MKYNKRAKVSDATISNGEVVKVHNSDEAFDALGSGKTIDTSEWEDEEFTVDDFFIAFEDFQLGDAPEPMHIEYNGDLATLVFDEESDEAVSDSILSFRQRAELRKMIKDAFAPGDIYNDGNVAGKVARVENDYVVVETQNEEGDVQNVEVPIEDFLDINTGNKNDIDIDTEDVNTNVAVNGGVATQDSAELPAKPEEQFEEPNPSDIVDSFEYEDDVDIYRAAIDTLTEQNITDIYDNGFTIIDAPSEVEDLDEFAKECAAEAQNMADQALGAEDQGALEILSAVEDGQIVLYIAQ